jgi:hypothetical protein
MHARGAGRGGGTRRPAPAHQPHHAVAVDARGRHEDGAGRQAVPHEPCAAARLERAPAGRDRPDAGHARGLRTRPARLDTGCSSNRPARRDRPRRTPMSLLRVCGQHPADRCLTASIGGIDGGDRPAWDGTSGWRPDNTARHVGLSSVDAAGRARTWLPDRALPGQRLGPRRVLGPRRRSHGGDSPREGGTPPPV